MKTWLIGIVFLLLWSAGSTYWYVCRVKGLCWEMNAGGEASNLVGDTNSATGNATAGSSAAPLPADAAIDTATAGTEDSEPAAAATHSPDNTPASGNLAKPYTVLFAFAGPQPENPAAFDQYLADLSAQLKAHPSQKAHIQGYTDDTAARENNLKLAQRRCDVIANQLRALGVSDGQIVTEPLGEQDPVATNDTPAGRRLNRRVVISIQE